MAGAVSSCLRGEGEGTGGGSESTGLVRSEETPMGDLRQLSAPLRLLPKGDEKLAISKVHLFTLLCSQMNSH